MKKIFALVLALLMVGSLLVACSGSDEPKGEVTPLPEKETTAPTEQETTPAETEPEETEPEETEPAATEGGDKEVSLGAMQGGVYTNTYVGFTCTLDENWVFATAEQLQDLPGAVSDLFTDSSLADQLGTQIFDMQAENATDLVSMNVVYQKLDLATRLAYASMTEEEIIDQVLAQQDMMIQAYEATGIIATKLEKVTVTFCGKTRTAIMMTATIGEAPYEVPYFTLQLFDCQLGEYSVTTTFASLGENNTESLLAMCSPA